MEGRIQGRWVYGRSYNLKEPNFCARCKKRFKLGDNVYIIEALGHWDGHTVVFESLPILLHDECYTPEKE